MIRDTGGLGVGGGGKKSKKLFECILVRRLIDFSRIGEYDFVSF